MNKEEEQCSVADKDKKTFEWKSGGFRRGIEKMNKEEEKCSVVIKTKINKKNVL